MSETSMENGAMPAFPPSALSSGSHCGLTKREYIAAICLQGLLANKTSHNRSFWTATHSAVMYADQLLQTLEEDISDEPHLPSPDQIPLPSRSMTRPS